MDMLTENLDEPNIENKNISLRKSPTSQSVKLAVDIFKHCSAFSAEKGIGAVN